MAFGSLFSRSRAQRDVLKLESAMEQKPPQTSEEAAERFWNEHLQNVQSEGKTMAIGADILDAYFHGSLDQSRYSLYSRAAQLVFERGLERSSNPLVVFTGGGPGSGKSEILVTQIGATDYDGIIFDSNFSVYERAQKQIQQVRAAGKKPLVCGILTDVEAARRFTLEREERGGKKIPDDVFAFGHANFPKVLKRLLEEAILSTDEVILFDFRNVLSLEDAKRAIVEMQYPQGNLLDVLASAMYDEAYLRKQYAATNFQR